jgi:outer membrane lipoprotein carrier protein
MIYADGITQFHQFLKRNNIRANFTQTVIGIKKNLVSNGILEISRPNKFKWNYISEGQVIISDGRTIYIYDQPLQQVTEKKFTATIGKSPAVLLAGDSNINTLYNITNLPNNNGISWVKLTPKKSNDNNGFKDIKIGLQNSLITSIIFIDNFDHKTKIELTNIKTGIIFPRNNFRFTIESNIEIVKDNN